MREAIDRVRGRKEIRSTQGQPFDSVVAEMLIEPRPPCGAHGVTGLQHRLEPRSKTATNKTEMAAMLARHQLENGIRLPVTLGAEHDPFIGPLHGISPESPLFSRLVTHGGVTSTADTFPIHNVMAGHSRLKDGVLSHAYIPAIHVFLH